MHTQFIVLLIFTDIRENHSQGNASLIWSGRKNLNGWTYRVQDDGLINDRSTETNFTVIWTVGLLPW